MTERKTPPKRAPRKSPPQETFQPMESHSPKLLGTGFICLTISASTVAIVWAILSFCGNTTTSKVEAKPRTINEKIDTLIWRTNKIMKHNYFHKPKTKHKKHKAPRCEC